MSATERLSRLCRRSIPCLVGSVALSTVITLPSHAEPSSSPEPSGLSEDDGVTIDELQLHAKKIGELLDHASTRVDRLAGDTDDTSNGRALIGAIRQELDLSRQWNRHLSAILIEVAEARRDLGLREKKAAAEINELTAIAEEARLELVELWKSLEADQSATPVQPKLIPTPKPETDQHSSLETRKSSIFDITDDLAGPQANIDQARLALERMSEAQKLAANDIDAVRTKIIDALQTLAPHRATPLDVELLQKSRHESSLSSEDITAWAASIAGKLHHEGYDRIEQVNGDDEKPAEVSAKPDIEIMLVNSELAATASIRAAPNHRSPILAKVREGSAILVTGKVSDLDWYRVEISDGRHGFVPGTFIKRQSPPLNAKKRIKESSNQNSSPQLMPC